MGKEINFNGVEKLTNEANVLNGTTKVFLISMATKVSKPIISVAFLLKVLTRQR